MVSPIFRVVSSDYGKPRFWTWLAQILRKDWNKLNRSFLNLMLPFPNLFRNVNPFKQRIQHMPCRDPPLFTWGWPVQQIQCLQLQYICQSSARRNEKRKKVAESDSPLQLHVDSSHDAIEMFSRQNASGRWAPSSYKWDEKTPIYLSL